jgi:hypothetical protein
VLGQAQYAGAVREERGIALAKVELARVELGDVGDQLDRVLALLTGEASHAPKEIRVGESSSGGEQSMLHDRVSSSPNELQAMARIIADALDTRGPIAKKDARCLRQAHALEPRDKIDTPDERKVASLPRAVTTQ